MITQKSDFPSSQPTVSSNICPEVVIPGQNVPGTLKTQSAEFNMAAPFINMK